MYARGDSSVFHKLLFAVFFLFLILQLILSMWCQVTKSLFETASNLQYFFTSVKEFVFSSMVRLFVSKTTKTKKQKLPNRFPMNLEGGAILAQQSPHLPPVLIRIKGQIQYDIKPL